MSGTLFTLPRYVPVNSGGNPYPLSTLTFYQAGTTTLANVYTTAALSVAHSNPLTSNSAGLFAAVYLDPSVAYDYKVVLKNSSGSTLWTEDNIPGNINRQQVTAAETAAAVTPADYSYDPGDSRRYSTLANWAAVGAGHELTLVGDYTVTAGLTFPAGTNIRGVSRPTLTSTVDGAATLTFGSNCSIEGVTLIGPAAADYDADENAIYFAGSSAASYVSGITVKDCVISGFGYAGVYGKWCEHVHVERNRITDCGYAGVLFLSATDAHAHNNYIADITPGTGGNAYGVAFTRDSAADSLATYPRSVDCSATFNVIEDIPVWEALDTHSGERITFAHNTINNCKTGVAVGPSSSVGNPSGKYAAPHHCTVVANVIDGNDLGGYGISLTGANSGTVGTPTELGEGNVVKGNSLYRCGISENNIAGSMYFHTLLGVAVTGNTIRESNSHGMLFYYDVHGLALNGNVIIDPHDPTLTNVACVSFEAGNFTGIVSGNAFVKVTAGLDTYVGEYGLYWATAGTSTLKAAANVSTCDTDYYGTNFAVAFTNITDSTTGTAGDVVNDTTASVKDDIATLAAKINAIATVLKAVQILD